MDDHKEFLEERRARIKSYGSKKELLKKGDELLIETLKEAYSYNFSWMGLPIIQYPQDIVALQEIIWSAKPDMIIETGVARGGSLAFYASMLELIGGDGIVVGIDIDMRAHNRRRIEKHPLAHRIRLIEGSSLDEITVKKVEELSQGKKEVLVSLDSNHSHEHALKELELYSPFVTAGNYCVVFDTIIEMMPKGSYPDRPWDLGDNPATAIVEFLKDNSDFVVDEEIDKKLLLSAARGGYLRKKY